MQNAQSPFALQNIRLFIAFRIFFNARFYYPVFTILFLDFGLSIEQFALLNTVWAITIVLAEVPSGALADLFGRKYLLVATSLLMVVEMAVLAFVPLGNSTLIFWAFLINRVLSGLAEAMASGADEAIAYDTLVTNGDAKDWPKVLSLQMRLRSITSIVTMTIGALLYDPNIVNHILTWLGLSTTLSQQTTMRFPIYLTLILAILATVTAFRMQEVTTSEDTETVIKPVDALKKTVKAGKWIYQTPFALAIILFGMCFDHVLRMIVTMTSQYFRLIHLPEASFGLIGSAMALLGLITPKIAEQMAEKNSPAINAFWIAAITLVGLVGLTGFYPYVGLLPMALIFVAIMLVSFFSSHYLNSITESHQRATVLSFKGLAFNLAYGIIGVLFAQLIIYQRHRGNELLPQAEVYQLEAFAFQGAIGWFPGYAVICITLTAVYCWYRLRNTDIPRHDDVRREV